MNAARTVKLLAVAATIAVVTACSNGRQSFPSSGSNILPGARDAVDRVLHPGVSPTAVKGAIRTQIGNGKSWSKVRSHSASSLLYVTDPGQGSVEFYTYDNGNNIALQGQIFGFMSPGQPCVDKAGNVFIPDSSLKTVTEFAHGGTTAIQTLKDPGTPTGCSVDKTTGDLATADFGQSQVAVYAGATGKPKRVPWATTTLPEYVGYDNAGNLFIEGQLSGGGGGVLGELPSGGGSISDLTLNGFTLQFAGSIMWGGTFLLVGDQGIFDSSSWYSVTVSGTTATNERQEIFLQPVTDVTGYWKRGAPHYAHIVAADFGSTKSAGVYQYPVPNLVNAITNGIVQPFGVTISP